MNRQEKSQQFYIERCKINSGNYNNKRKKCLPDLDSLGTSKSNILEQYYLPIRWILKSSVFLSYYVGIEGWHFVEKVTKNSQFFHYSCLFSLPLTFLHIFSFFLNLTNPIYIFLLLPFTIVKVDVFKNIMTATPNLPESKPIELPGEAHKVRVVEICRQYILQAFYGKNNQLLFLFIIFNHFLILLILSCCKQYLKNFNQFDNELISFSTSFRHQVLIVNIIEKRVRRRQIVKGEICILHGLKHLRYTKI